MAVLAALSNICLTEDLSKNLKRTGRSLGGIWVSSVQVTQFVTNEACFPRESSSLSSN